MQALKTRAALPLRAAGKNGPNNERIGWRLNQENSKHLGDWQTLGDVTGDVVERLRVARLRRQFGLGAETAALIASLAYGEGRNQ